MRTAVLGVVLAGLLFGPVCCLLAMAVALDPTAQGSCLPGGSLVVAHQPARLTARRSDGVTVTLGPAQLTRAASIISVGAGTHGVGRRGVVIALMAALTESRLRMLANTSAYPASATYPHDGDGGNLDSLGMFQMRPSAGWGSVPELMDPEYQAEAFFGGPEGPNLGTPAGLLDIPGWRYLPPGQAAQAVEVSAYPGRYTPYQPVAAAILDAMAAPTATGSCPGSTHAATPPLPAGFAGAFLAAATSQLGTPYVWGGGTYTGPSGIAADGRGPGFDCSGLVLYAAYQASHGALRLPHYTGAQITYGQPVTWDAKRPGDLIFFTQPGSATPHHVAIYLGGEQILQAPKTGENVRVGTIGEFAGDAMTVRRLGG